jgi:hypothetical protein
VILDVELPLLFNVDNHWTKVDIFEWMDGEFAEDRPSKDIIYVTFCAEISKAVILVKKQF